MRMSRAIAGLLIVIGCSALLGAGKIPEDRRPEASGLHALAAEALSPDRQTAERAIERLRARGPAGWEAFWAMHGDMIQEYQDRSLKQDDDPRWQRVRRALDAVSGQRDAHASRLFWYTDLDEAKQAARREQKPILSLRLLGQLTDEFSCANSRFFRSVLYPNERVGDVLRDQFILHWKSVRPVPRVTIDFGDGRRLERTLTGNSIHYVLDAQGRPLDAVPGLYGPQAFLEWLQRMHGVADDLAAQSEAGRAELLKYFHRSRQIDIHRVWMQDLRRLGVDVNSVQWARTSNRNSASARRNNVDFIPAAEATQIAVGKSLTENPILMATSQQATRTLAASTTDELWKRMAQLHHQNARLDAASLAFIRTQNPTAGLSDAKGTPAALERMIQEFQNAIALDTVRNEYLLHRSIHKWFVDGQVTELNALNRRVYAELFLTPDTDRWLGLLPPGAYSGLEDNGVYKNRP